MTASQNINRFLEGLNPRQREAVLATEGPVLILAGPGSGKTATITRRIAYLIARGITPEQILGVTVTNKAAGEMKERISRLLMANSKWQIRHTPHADGQMPFIGTFHAFCVRILRAYASQIGYFRGFSIFDEDDSLSLMKETLKELGINPKQFAPGMLLNVISGLKNELTSPEKYEEDAGLSDLFPRTVHQSYLRYQERLYQANAMDFDDLLMKTVLLFEKHPDILTLYQDRFRYIHVDEWQDTNHAQYVLISQLAKKYGNIAVVGDDAQSIYSFRGADYRNILNFEKDWPDAKVIVLDQNYRSTQTILDAAREVISRNLQQKEKRLWTERKGGEALSIVAAENERSEAQFVGETVRELLDQGIARKDLVILYRTNAQSRVLEDAMLERDIPYKIVGGVKFYQRKEVKDILAYVRYILNPKDLVSLKRIINVPARGIGKQTLLAYLYKDRLNGKAGSAALEGFDRLIASLTGLAADKPAAGFIRDVLRLTRYREYLEDGSTNAEERWENVQELVSLAKKYDDAPPTEGLEKMIEDAALMSDQDEVRTDNDMVHLMTLHAAKGLEFPVVFMVGIEEGVLPHARSLFNPVELEEERRLCYVGLTRAKEKIFLSFALSRTLFGSTQVNPPSRFLSEIPERLVKPLKEPAIEI
jgi:DNA helicase-2/ATP-dependent DNA helicase PcrA